MTLASALYGCCGCLSLAVLLQCAEHRHASLGERRLFLLRALCCLGLLLNLALLGAPNPQEVNLFAGLCCVGIFVLGALSLQRFAGPYCGGSDLMTLLISLCLSLALLLPSAKWKTAALGYLAIQLSLSYWQSGWVKITNPAWRSGQALVDVFAYTFYPVSERVRAWADHPKLLRTMAWCVIGFELLFPLSLYYAQSLLVALAIAALFHLANACLFGLNRFVWIWLSAYPALIWWQPYMAEFMRR
jgi:hypothetical protein